MRYRQICLAALALLIIGTGAGSAQDAKPIQLSAAPNIQDAVIVIAIDQGFFKKVGLEVQTIRFESGQRGLEALLGGQLDLSVMAEYPPVIAALQNKHFSIVADVSQYIANRFIIRADANISGPQDLAGKKIGTAIATNVAYAAEDALARAGVKAELVNVAPPTVVQALARGDIDAGVTFPDYNPRAKSVLGAKYREVLIPDYRSHFVIAASESFAKSRPDDLKKFLSALVEADKFIKADPTRAKDIVVKASGGTVAPEEIAEVWPEYIFNVDLGTGLLETMASEQEWVVAKDIIKGAKADKAALRAYISDAPLRAVSPESVTLP